MGKITKDFKYNYAQDFDYDDSLIEITAGKAQVVGTAGVYGTSVPYITTEKSLIATSLNSFTETATTGTGDLIKYILTVDGEDKYFGTGDLWQSSNGTFAQSNLASEIQTNSSTVISGRSRLNLKAFLSSFNGATTPQLSNVNLSYNINFYCLPDDVRSQLVGIDKANLSDEEILTYIENADNTIDFYIGMQYDLPITDATTLKLLRTWSSILASYTLYTYLANKEGSNIATMATARYEKLIETLEKISNSEMQLTNMPNISRIASNFSDYTPTFNEGDPVNWSTDANMLSDISSGSFYG